MEKYKGHIGIVEKAKKTSSDTGIHQKVGRRSNVGMARMKSHVIRVQKASKLNQKA